MSILDNSTYKEQLITPTRLKKQYFSRDGWGSPATRKEKNTNMYEKFLYVAEDGYMWHIQWFPKNFEGRVCINGYHADVRQRCVASHGSSHQYYVSPKLKTMDDLNIFIQLVTHDKVKPIRIRPTQDRSQWTEHGYTID